MRITGPTRQGFPGNTHQTEQRIQSDLSLRMEREQYLPFCDGANSASAKHGDDRDRTDDPLLAKQVLSR